MQCIPLYSLLLAMGNPTVNLLVLDVEGAETLVIRTVPWHKVDVQVFSCLYLYILITLSI
jgi:hypothetical protein